VTGASPENPALRTLVDQTLREANLARPSTITSLQDARPVDDASTALAVAKTADRVRALLAAGADPNRHAALGWPLLVQAQRPDVESAGPAIVALLAGGADPMARDGAFSASTALHLRRQAQPRLHARAARPRCPRRRGGRLRRDTAPPQHSPRRARCVPGAGGAAAAGTWARPGAIDRENTYALTNAVDHPEVVRLLLAAGAPPRVAFPYPGQPLDMARRRDVQGLLIAAGAGTRSQRWLYAHGQDANLLRHARARAEPYLPFSGLLLPVLGGVLWAVLVPVVPALRRRPRLRASARGAFAMALCLALYTIALTVAVVQLFTLAAGKVMVLVLPVATLVGLGLGAMAFRRAWRSTDGRERPATDASAAH
jgi:hypothetical protein